MATRNALSVIWNRFILAGLLSEPILHDTKPEILCRGSQVRFPSFRRNVIVNRLKDDKVVVLINVFRVNAASPKDIDKRDIKNGFLLQGRLIFLTANETTDRAGQYDASRINRQIAANLVTEFVDE